jgi:hypothetical protein
MRATTFTVKRHKAGGLVLCVMALLGAAQTARGQSSILGTNPGLVHLSRGLRGGVWRFELDSTYRSRAG